MKRLNQTGSQALVIAVLVLALAGVGFAGYTVYQARSNDDAQATSTTKAAPDTITGTEDLQQTSEALDSASTDLDTNLDDSGLDADLDSML